MFFVFMKEYAGPIIALSVILGAILFTYHIDKTLEVDHKQMVKIQDMCNEYPELNLEAKAAASDNFISRPEYRAIVRNHKELEKNKTKQEIMTLEGRDESTAFN